MGGILGGGYGWDIRRRLWVTLALHDCCEPVHTHVLHACHHRRFCARGT